MLVMVPDIMLLKKNQHVQFGIKIITICPGRRFILYLYDDDNNRLENNELRKSDKTIALPKLSRS